VTFDERKLWKTSLPATPRQARPMAEPSAISQLTRAAACAVRSRGSIAK
jgi:hypothetical protein